jgi:molybdopterin-guanine dinucleotide biosynthesis protein A
MTHVIGVVLAGGKARRMGGRDKGLLRLNDQTLMSRVVARLIGQVDDVVINANGDRRRFAAYGLPVIPDTMADFPGPLAGVLAGMEFAATQGATHIVTAAADTPFFPVTLLQGLQSAANTANTANSPIALAASEEEGRLVRHPTFGLWPVDLRDDLRAALTGGLRKVVLWTDTHNAATATFPTGSFFNINTPEDLELAEAQISRENG